MGGPGQEMGSGTIKIPMNYCCFYTSAQRCHFLANLINACESKNHSEIYVWLEGTELITQTDENGDFKMPLPTSSEQGTGSIVTGTYKLYFYLANYRLEYVTIELLNVAFINPIPSGSTFSFFFFLICLLANFHPF